MFKVERFSTDTSQYSAFEFENKRDPDFDAIHNFLCKCAYTLKMYSTQADLIKFGKLDLERIHNAIFQPITIRYLLERLRDQLLLINDVSLSEYIDRYVLEIDRILIEYWDI